MTTDAQATPGTVLVVDDEEDARKLLAHLLERRGYRAILADGGPSAIEALRTAAVDVILLDVMMPAMDGFAVCRELRKSEATRSIPVILLTALDDVETRSKGMNLGVGDFLTKPVNKEELFARVATQIEAGHRAQRLDRAQKRADALDP